MKDTYIKIRLTDEEKDEISVASCKKHKGNKSKFIREAINEKIKRGRG